LESDVKKTALHAEHMAAGAKMVDFAGWAMPIFYRSIVSEHLRVRSTVGLFDVSHMGEFIVAGRDAEAALDRITTNAVSTLAEGSVHYSVMCLESGGIIDDLLVYRLPDHYMLVVNATNREKDLTWIRSNLKGDAQVRDVSDETALIALQGPDSASVLAKASGEDVSRIAYFRCATLSVAGRDVLVSRTGYTGEDGFEMYCGLEEAPRLWGAMMDAGSGFDIEPIGLGARDTLRLEMGYCLYGSDIDEMRTPVEAGLMWIVQLEKGDFVGRRAVLDRKEAGPRERLVGFQVTDRGIPRPGNRILAGSRAVGVVTSGTYSPSLGEGIGLGYVETGVGDDIGVEIRGVEQSARRVDLPFYRNGSVQRGRPRR
jgi:aminomethyltransferase